MKFWIINGACHANYAIVFAQTIAKGKNEGVNGIIVRIRNDHMKPCKGVFIKDISVKKVSARFHLAEHGDDPPHL